MTACSSSVKQPPAVFPLAPAADAPALAFMPDIGGSVLYTRKLVAAFGSAVASFGMRLDQDLIDRLEGLTLAEVGERFAANLIASPLQPPYRLAGHSFAALLAFETARALERRDLDVAKVYLLDAAVPPQDMPGARGANQAFYRLGASTMFYVRSTKDALTRLREGGERGQVLAKKGFVRMNLAAHPEPYRDIIRNLYRAMVAFRPGPYGGDVMLLRGVGNRFARAVPEDFGWGRFVSGELERVDIRTDHLGMVHEDAATRSAAAAIVADLTSAGARRPRGPGSTVSAMEG